MLLRFRLSLILSAVSAPQQTPLFLSLLLSLLLCTCRVDRQRAAHPHPSLLDRMILVCHHWHRTHVIKTTFSHSRCMHGVPVAQRRSSYQSALYLFTKKNGSRREPAPISHLKEPACSRPTHHYYIFFDPLASSGSRVTGRERATCWRPLKFRRTSMVTSAIFRTARGHLVGHLWSM